MNKTKKTLLCAATSAVAVGAIATSSIAITSCSTDDNGVEKVIVEGKINPTWTIGMASFTNYTATVVGVDKVSQEVTWSISNSYNGNLNINEDGKLLWTGLMEVGSYTFKVIATSVQGPSKKGVLEVTMTVIG